MPRPKTRTTIKKVKKRDGSIASFDIKKIERAIWQAAKAAGGADRKRAKYLTGLVIKELESRFNQTITPEVEQIQDIVEKILLEQGHEKTYKAFTLYRDLQRKSRDIRSLVDSDELIKSYLNKSDWLVKENANMTYSLQGLNNHVASIISSNFWLNQIYPREVRKGHLDGDIHIHDLALVSAYCCGWDLKDLLLRGFGGVQGKVHSRPPKHFRTALGQLVNFFYTLQGEVAGAVAVANFDTYLAPFIYYDKLNYKDVKQAMQEFIYNMNVPTRVGFQCVSEDTEILTPEGWKNYQEVKIGGVIKTFNLKTQVIENQKVTSVFKKEYQGEMYNLKNRIQDQLISPGHRVVRKKFQTKNKFVLEPIEEILKLKSPFMIPIAGKNINKKTKISDDQIKLMAWIIAEGSMEKPGRNYRSCYRISIYQSKIKNLKNYEEIKNLLNNFNLKYSEFQVASLGDMVVRLRLNAESSRLIHSWFGTRENVHFIPEKLLNMDEEQSRLFLMTYLKADGFEECKISTGEWQLLGDLQRMVVNCGYGFTVLKRQPTIGKKEIYVLRIIRHPETYIEEVRKINYKGVIWCPHTKNETIVARRKGKVFVTGNTPFTNVTLDLKPTKTVGEEAVIIAGQPQKTHYKDFQKEIDLFNKVFAQVMSEGDAQGRVFTFPIPTYSVTRDFDWDNPVLEPVFEMTRKYGIPYWANYVNSDMSPEDSRSMCCRLKIDNRVLRKRGGLFAANPQTGAIGVVTVNLPRIGFLSRTKKEFLLRLRKAMRICRDSLLIKRKTVEEFTEKGLYPYCRYYLSDVKARTGKYWTNHFNTIGINGMNEALLNFLGKNIAEPEGKAFALELMDFMRKQILEFQRKTGELFNLEATPAEGTSYRFAKIDKQRYPRIQVANEKDMGKDGIQPFYTNSTHLPVDYTDDIFEALDHQDEIQQKYNGGTVLHGFLGESLPDTRSVKNLVKKIAENYHLPYFTLTPTFSVCPKHGYLSGEWQFCPKCDEEIGYKKLKVF